MSVEVDSSPRISSALKEPTSLSKTLETKYGHVNIDQYNRRLTVEDVKVMLAQVEQMPRRDTNSLLNSIRRFITDWNLRAFYLPDDQQDKLHLHSLVNAAVDRDHLELVRFIYHKLVYDSRFYSLIRVNPTSIHSADMRDLLVKYTLRFEGDYEEELAPFRQTLRGLTFT